MSKSILRGIPDIVTSRENLILSLCVLWFTHCPQRKKQLGITEKSNIADFKVKNKEHAMETLKLINLKWSSHHGQQKSLKCSTWMQAPKQQNYLCSFPRQTIQYHGNPSLCPDQ